MQLERLPVDLFRLPDIRCMCTVIRINWTGTKFLPKCLEGLRRQVFRHFTAILVDNGSIDFIRRNYPEVGIIALHENIRNDILKK